MGAVMAVSLHRPWPAAIFTLGKNIENREWSNRYRGYLAIHAAKKYDQNAAILIHQLGMAITDVDAQHSTGYIGIAELYDVCNGRREEDGGCWEKVDDFIRGEIRVSKCGRWAMRGNQHWKLRNFRAFSSAIPGNGRQGIYAVPQPEADLIREACKP